MLWRWLLGGVLSAVVLMGWGFLYWVVLSAPGEAPARLPQEQQVVAVLRGSVPSGVYYFPGLQEGGDMSGFQDFRQRHALGPTGMLMISQQGSDPMAPRVFATGFAHFLVSALLAGALLWAMLPLMERYWRRVGFVLTLGLFAAVAVKLAEPIWWHLPWGFHLRTAVFTVVGWLLAGMVLAALLRPHRGLQSLQDTGKPLWKRALDAG